MAQLFFLVFVKRKMDLLGEKVMFTFNITAMLPANQITKFFDC